MTDAPKPAPCPWCGLVTMVQKSAFRPSFFVMCCSFDCEACGPVAVNESAAVAAWNRVAKEAGHE